MSSSTLITHFCSAPQVVGPRRRSTMKRRIDDSVNNVNVYSNNNSRSSNRNDGASVRLRASAASSSSASSSPSVGRSTAAIAASATSGAGAAATEITASFSELPVLRLPPRGCPPEEEAAFCETLRGVCHTIGFFYVRSHGVEERTCDAAIDAARRFFALPASEKSSIDNRNSPAFRGYVRLGAENTAGSPDYREQIEFGVEAEAPALSLSDEEAREGCDPVKDPAGEDSPPPPPPYLCLVGPNQWPDAAAVPGFKPAVIDYLDGMEHLSRRLMELLALSLHLPGDHFHPTFGDDPNVQMKIARYPPAPPGAEGGGGGSFGVGAHTDSGYLSILLQDDVGGLQVQNGDGDWIDAPPLPGCVVVNLGEMLQLCTR